MKRILQWPHPTVANCSSNTEHHLHGGVGVPQETGCFILTHYPYKETLLWKHLAGDGLLIKFTYTGQCIQILHYSFLAFILLSYFHLVWVWFYWSNVKILADRNLRKSIFFFLPGYKSNNIQCRKSTKKETKNPTTEYSLIHTFPLSWTMNIGLCFTHWFVSRFAYSLSQTFSYNISFSKTWFLAI